MMKPIFYAIFLSVICFSANAQRETVCLNKSWKFSTANSLSFEGNFFTGTRYFNYLTKAGYADGPALPEFDDRAWRVLDLPHDFAVEQNFAPDGSHSHGYKAIGWKYPQNSTGWYRKSINIASSDFGKRISLVFDGVFRNSEVWFNGFYLGLHQSGYTGFEYDVTDYVNYGGNNVITVKADATLEEGWFYEGAGIYRNTRLLKTSALHVKSNGIFVSNEIFNNKAELTVRAEIENRDQKSDLFDLTFNVFDNSGKKVASENISGCKVNYFSDKTFYKKISISDPQLWDVENPNLYTVEVVVNQNGKNVDSYKVRTGIRTVEFDAEKGFFLNGKHLKLIGSNVHQDFAGVGVALPDELQFTRVKILKDFGSNCVRTSHNPVNIEFLDACDSLGLIVLEETRLEGINDYHFNTLKEMILRDRNHPSIVAWGVGNEEWQIESNIYGNRITKTIMDFSHTLDSTRLCTVAISGGCGYGSSEPIDIMGFNYLAQCDIDQYHSKFPDQPGWGTEETSGCGTRGCYQTDSAACAMVQMDLAGGTSIERGFKFYAERDWLCGLFFWTGFDYRGEPTPFSYPAIGSQFGLTDMCGFRKDAADYIDVFTSQTPKVHLFPHWSFPGMESKNIVVRAYTNCSEAELFFNKKSLGKQSATKYGHCEWNVNYQPGTLTVKAYQNGKVVAVDEHKTCSKPVAVVLKADKQKVFSDKEDVVLIAVSAVDSKGIEVPYADNEIKFNINGDASIIGVGNGNPSSLEKDVYFPLNQEIKINNLKEMTIKNIDNFKIEIANSQIADWRNALVYDRNERWDYYHDTLLAVKGEFIVDNITDSDQLTLFSKSILFVQNIYVNGHEIAKNIKRDEFQEFKIDKSYLKEGKNEILYVGKKIRKSSRWDEPNTNPGVVGRFAPADQYKRKLFNGKALLVVKVPKGSDGLSVNAQSDGLKSSLINITK